MSRFLKNGYTPTHTHATSHPYSRSNCVLTVRKSLHISSVDNKKVIGWIKMHYVDIHKN